MKRRVMMKPEPQNHDTSGDPIPTFATDAEIEIADRLRHQLEERYLAPSTPRALRRAAASSGEHSET
jgi:hypothetical protein